MRALAALAVMAGCYVDRPVPVPVIVSPVPPHEAAFVFVSARDTDDRWSKSQLYLGSVDGTAINLTNDANTNSSPAVSPDGRRVAFVSWRTGTHHLHVMELATREVHAIDAVDGTVQSPRWSGGHRIGYEAPPNAPGTAVWLYDDRDSEPRKLTEPSDREADDGGLAFIDGGRRVVFSRYDRTTQDRDLYVASTDDGTTRRLTESLHESETEPVASHDGKLLAYRLTRMGHDTSEAIRIVAIADWSLVRDIALPPPAHWNISGIDFAPDDRALVFGADASDVGGSLQNLHGEIFTIDVDGTNLRRITKNAAYDGQPAALPR